MDDLKLIKEVKDNADNQAIRELIDRHSGIYIRMVQKYIPESNEDLIYQDFIDEKDSSIYHAAISFDESKNTKFSTYVGNMAKWKCMNAYNKCVNKHKRIIDEERENLFAECFDYYNKEDVENVEKIIKIIDQLSDQRAKTIFKMRYFEGRKITPWKKIAKKLDLSIQGCINIHNKNLMEIKNICQSIK
jgi:RNA polymerase sigma factor (sigma-70 family)